MLHVGSDLEARPRAARRWPWLGTGMRDARECCRRALRPRRPHPSPAVQALAVSSSGAAIAPLLNFIPGGSGRRSAGSTRSTSGFHTEDVPNHLCHKQPLRLLLVGQRIGPNFSIFFLETCSTSARTSKQARAMLAAGRFGQRDARRARVLPPFIAPAPPAPKPRCAGARRLVVCRHNRPAAECCPGGS